MYFDLVEVKVRLEEARATHRGVTVSTGSFTARAARVYTSRGWVVVSSNKLGPDELLARAARLAAAAGGGRGLPQGRGTSLSWGRRCEEPGEGEALSLLEAALAAGLPSAEVRVNWVEFSVASPVEGWSAWEQRCWVEVSTPAGSVAVDYEAASDSITEGLAEAWRLAATRGSPSPVRGRLQVLLSPQAAGSLLVALAEALTWPPRLTAGYQLLPEGCTLTHEPLAAWAPGRRVLDDEASEAARRELVVDGLVKSYVGTRAGGPPGYARGLLEAPRPAPVALSLEARGGWEEAELARLAALLVTDAEAVLAGDAVRLEVRRAYLLRSGSVVAPARVSRVTLDLGSLRYSIPGRSAGVSYHRGCSVRSPYILVRRAYVE